MTWFAEMRVEVVVEVPCGSRNKYEADHDTGEIWLDRTLYTATVFPTDYGYIPDTLGADGDPLDGLVVLEASTFPGCHVLCRPIAVLWIESKRQREAKILCVPATDGRRAWRTMSDIPGHVRAEISHFFDVYKDLGPGKTKTVGAWEGRRAAEEAIRRARRRAENGAS